jgi:endoglycosylceramidase
MSLRTLSLAALLLSCSPPPAHEPGALSSLRLTVDGPLLRDAAGREVWLRGVNAGGRSKLPPFLPFEFRESGLAEQAAAPPFDEALARYADRIAGFGQNVVRLPWSWEGLEPTRGQLDEQYLERYLAMARAFSARGIRVVVDLHQDVFARPYCGDGFPLWACPQPLPTTPQDCSGWFTAYLGASPEVQLAFDRLWRNEDGLSDALVAAWRKLAARAWSIDGVVGFDLMNEPYPGSAPLASWYRQTLEPFYRRLGAAIHEVAPGAVLLVEPTGTEGPAARTELERPGPGFVLAPHYYHPLIFMFGEWTGSASLDEPIAGWASEAAAWPSPLVIGELGAGRAVKGGLAYLRALFDALDRVGAHAMLWEVSESRVEWNGEDFSLITPDGHEAPTLAGLLRVYPRAVAGSLRSFHYDAATRSAELAFLASPGGRSELAVPARLYPEGATASLEGVAGEARYRPEQGAVLVEAWTAGSARVRVGPR